MLFIGRLVRTIPVIGSDRSGRQYSTELAASRLTDLGEPHVTANNLMDPF